MEYGRRRNQTYTTHFDQTERATKEHRMDKKENKTMVCKIELEMPLGIADLLDDQTLKEYLNDALEHHAVRVRNIIEIEPDVRRGYEIKS